MKLNVRYICCLLLSFIAVGCLNASAALNLVRNEGGLLPIKRLGERRIVVVNVGAKISNTFSDICSRYAKVDKISLLNNISESERQRLQQADVVIAGVYATSEKAKELFAEVLKMRNVVVVLFMDSKSASKMNLKSTAKSVIITGGNTLQLQSLAAQAVFGGVGVSGNNIRLQKVRLGYATPESVGFDARLDDKIDSIVTYNISKQSFPGCQVVVVKDGKIVIDKAYGRLDYSSKAPRVNRETLYDIASMTKATATIAGLMKAYDNRLFNLNDPISKYILNFRGTDKQDITIRELLYHKSGFPAVIDTYTLLADSNTYSGKLYSVRRRTPYTVKLDRRFYGNSNARMRRDVVSTSRSSEFPHEIAKGLFAGDALRQEVMNTIYTRPLGDKKYCYSCLNFCLLMQMEETVTKISHDKWVQNSVFAPIGAWHAGFRPTTYYDVSNIAPTEKDNFMRKQHIRGFVHDELAAYSGGVQGNAGLFSNALDIAKLCQTWLNGGVYGGEKIFNAQTVELFTSEFDSESKRGLGFDRAVRIKSLEELGIPQSTYGHLGFTGTCFWVDPDNDIIFVLLCNRICPSRDNRAYSKNAPRAALLKEIYKAFKH